MCCERHCKECDREKHWRRAYDEQKRLQALPVEYREVRRFAWRPIRDPETGRTLWLQTVTLHFRTVVRYCHWMNWPGLDWELESVTASTQKE